MKKEDVDQLIYEESRLISLLNEDSEYAFQLIYDKHRNRIYQTALKFLKSPIIAQDVVQDVFMKFWFERHHIDASKPVEAWLYMVAKNNILNKLRKIANDWKAIDMLSHSILRSESNTESKLNEGELKRHLEAVVSNLPFQQKQVFIMSRFEKLTYIQIGKKMGISPLTVKTHLSRALHTIKKHFESKGLIFSILVIFSS
jgi:RNA polymerase sigma-70 factor (ECF subfamily)